MSAVKRKDGPGAPKGIKENPAKRKKFDTPEKKTTKSPKSNGAKPPAPASKASAPSTLQPLKSSVLTSLRDDEPMFPRGGGSVLTPLEQKKIQMQAKQDALDEANADELNETSSKPKAKARKERASRKKETKSTTDKVDPDAVKVESLSFKVSSLPSMLSFAPGLALYSHEPPIYRNLSRDLLFLAKLPALMRSTLLSRFPTISPAQSPSPPFQIPLPPAYKNSRPVRTTRTKTMRSPRESNLLVFSTLVSTSELA